MNLSKPSPRGATHVSACCLLRVSLRLFPGVESPQFTIRLARSKRPERRYIVRVGGRACARGLARSPKRSRPGARAVAISPFFSRSDLNIFIEILGLSHTQTMFYPTRRPPPQVTCRRAPQLYTQQVRLPANPSEPRVRLRVGCEFLQRDDGCIDAILQPAQLLYV